MTSTEIFDNLKEIISVIKPKLDLTNVNMDSSLLGDLGADSLSMLLLSLAVEKKFNINFDTDRKYMTVGDVVSYIAEKIG